MLQLEEIIREIKTSLYAITEYDISADLDTMEEVTLVDKINSIDLIELFIRMEDQYEVQFNEEMYSSVTIRNIAEGIIQLVSEKEKNQIIQAEIIEDLFNE